MTFYQSNIKIASARRKKANSIAEVRCCVWIACRRALNAEISCDHCPVLALHENACCVSFWRDSGDRLEFQHGRPSCSTLNIFLLEMMFTEKQGFLSDQI